MVTGVTRSFSVCHEEVRRVLAPNPGERVFGVMIVIARGRTIFIADTSVHERPTSVELADIAIQTAAKARQFGHEPRVALLSFSNFGNPMLETAQRVRDGVAMLRSRNPDFEIDGEMQADVALDYELMQKVYPFCKLSGPANVLVMPALHSANISATLLQKLGGGTVIGPLLLGLSKPVQIAPMGASAGQLVEMAAFAAHDAIAQGQPRLGL
jgi:malate dehydrogenase (oxaloacetate-decarboxylating)(NADP+)